MEGLEFTGFTEFTEFTPPSLVKTSETTTLKLKRTKSRLNDDCRKELLRSTNSARFDLFNREAVPPTPQQTQPKRLKRTKSVRFDLDKLSEISVISEN